MSRPALAQSPLPPAPPPPPDAPIPLVEVFGNFVPLIEYANATGATAPGSRVPGTTGASQVAAYSGLDIRARPVMDGGTSGFGFRGGVELTDDFAVTWQVDSGLQFDGTPAANTIASRNSNIGLTGSWGTLFAGNWDTPYKWATTTLVNPIRAGYISDFNGILSGPGFGVATVVTQQSRVNAAADAAFERRVGNSVQYWSPTVHGGYLRLAYSLFEGRTPDIATAPSIKPSILSAVVGFDRGTLKVRYSIEAHLDYFGMSQLGGSMGGTPTNKHSTDIGQLGIASYTHAQPGFDTRVVGVFEFLSYKNDDTNPTGIDSHSRAAYYALIDQTVMAKHHIYGGFGQAFAGSCSIVNGTSCSTTGLGANMGVLGYVYRFSKDTDFFALAYRITNDESASYSTFPPLGAPAVPAPGADVQGIGIGMYYQFSATILRGQRRGARPTSPPPAAPPAPAPATTPDAAPGPTPLPAPATNPAPAPVPPPEPTPAPPKP